MERIVRHLLVLGMVAVLLTTSLPRFLVRYLNQDFHITDIYYHVRNSDDIPLDDNIVLVNIGNLSRAEMAKQVYKISQFGPKVIALDVFFETAKDSVSDGIVQYVLATTPNVVLISLVQEDSAKNQVLDKPYAPFAALSLNGIGENLLEGGVGRKFQKRYIFPSGDTVLHFATQIAMLYDTATTQAFLDRPNAQEYIYFRGNIASFDAPHPSKFTVLDVEDVAQENFTPDLIQGKIVMMGYLGSYAGDQYSAEDKFFSPLNKEMSIRTLPDMFGVVFHANIVSMILSKKYVERLSRNEEILLGMAIFLFNLSVFWFLLASKRRREWYVVVSSLIIGTELAIYPYITVYLFTEYRYLAELSYTLLMILMSSYVIKSYIFSPIQYFRNKKAQTA